MHLNRATCVALASISLAAACSRADSPQTASNRSDPASGSVATAGKSATASDSAKTDTATTVTATGYGALRVGMSVASAALALKSPVPSTTGLDTACAYVRFANAPPGMRIMVVNGNVARIEIDSTSIATGLGARIGDPETRIHELYGSRVVVQPHKYTPNGHYLIINPIPASDTGYKLVFETDGSRVTKYRAGRMPEVEWVERCA